MKQASRYSISPYYEYIFSIEWFHLRIFARSHL